MVSKKDVGEMLRYCGVSDEKIEVFEEKFDESFGENAEIPPANLSGTKQLLVETPEVSVKVDAGYNSIVETRIINGVKYIMIRADNGAVVNGVNVQF